MSVSLGSAILTIGGDASGLNQALRRAEATTQSAMSKIGDVARIAGMGMTLVGGAITGVVGVALRESAEAEKAQAQLNQVIKSTGGIAGVTAMNVNELATAISRNSTFTDDSIVSASALMLTFTKVGKEVFPDAIQAATDMSVAMGQDLKSSVMQLGKALNEPIEGAGALRRVGVQLTDQQMEQITAFMKVNDLASAQKIIIKELATEFGGSASAAADTLSGQMQQLRNAMADVFEEIGNALTGGGGIRGLITYMKELALAAIEWMKSHPGLTAAIAKVTAVVGALMLTLGPFLMMLPGIVTAWGLVSGATAAAGTALATLAVAGGPIALVLIALAALAVAIYLVYTRWNEYRAAQAELEASNKRVEAGIQSLTEKYRAQGIAIDEVAMKDMTSNEKLTYLNQQRIAQRESNAGKEIEILTGVSAKTEEIHRAEMARIGLEIDERTAASIALTKLTDDDIRNFLRLSEAQKESLVELVNNLRASGADVDYTTREIRTMLERFSLDHRESPSINDLFRMSLTNMMEALVGLVSPMSTLLDGIRSMWASTWQTIFDQVMGTINALVLNASSALGWLTGGGSETSTAPGPRPQQFARGGVMQRPGLAYVHRDELMHLPGGTRIYNKRDTAEMLSGGGGLSVAGPLIGTLHVNGAQDVKEIAREISREIEREVQNTLAKRGRRLRRA